MAFCPNCGNQMPDEEKFCGSCGHNLAAEAQPTVNTEPAPQQSYTPPQQAYTPPQQGYTPPQQGYTPPQQGYTPPQQGYTPPQQGYTPPPGYVPPQQGYAPGAAPVFTGNKTMALLAMIFNLLFFLPLVAGDKTEYDTYYANQALVLLLLNFVSGILCMIIVGYLLYIFWFVCWIIGIINVNSGQMKPLPLIGKITIIK